MNFSVYFSECHLVYLVYNPICTNLGKPFAIIANTTCAAHMKTKFCPPLICAPRVGASLPFGRAGVCSGNGFDVCRRSHGREGVYLPKSSVFMTRVCDCESELPTCAVLWDFKEAVT